MSDEDASAAAEALFNGSNALYQLLAHRLSRRLSYDLLTILAPNETGDRLVRLFSSDIDRYPLGDADIVKDDKWFRRLFLHGQPIVANDAQAIGYWLPDFVDPVISDRGALVNAPIVIAGATLGLVNVSLHSGHYDQRDVDTIVKQSPLAALAILASRRAPRTFEVPSAVFSRYDRGSTPPLACGQET